MKVKYFLLGIFATVMVTCVALVGRLPIALCFAAIFAAWQAIKKVILKCITTVNCKTLS